MEKRKDDKITHLRIAMNLADIPVNEATVEIFLRCYELVKKKGGKGTLKDSCDIRREVEEKYKGTDVIHPDSFYKKIIDEKNKVINEQGKFIDSKKDQITDIYQWADLLVKNPKLRPRVWRSIASDISNRCTD
jgi:hypothetical protein